MEVKIKRNGEPNWDDIIYEPVAYSCGIDGKPNTIEVGFGWPKTKSLLKIGNMVIHSTHHFNWLQRKMWKLFFGFDIENVKENK